MTTPAIAPATAPAAVGDAAAAATPLLPAPLVRRVLGHALLLGIAADALVGDPHAGLGVPVWVALAALALVSLTWAAERDVPAATRRSLAAAVLFAAGLAWRDSETLEFFDFIATVFSLGMAAAALRDPQAGLLAGRLRDTVANFAAVVRRVVVGIVPLALAELFAPRERGRVRSAARPAARAVLIAGSLLLVFGSLLRSADPVFASIVTLPALDMGALVQDAIVIGGFAWVAGGWAIGALAEPDSRRAAPRGLPFELGLLDVTTALGTLNALFAAFVLAQLGTLFGGEAFLRARTGLSAAEYARGGFFQMLLVVMLVVPLLVATRAALAPGHALERRHTVLSLPVVVLLGAIIASAVWRMRMYVHFYGLTIDRFYPLVFMGWLAVVLAWLAVTVLRGRGRPFVAGAVLSGLATLVALNVAAPDAIVARVNVARAWRPATGTTPTLDLEHLVGLSGEAAAVAVPAVLAPSLGALGTPLRAASDAARCSAAHTLLRRWTALDPKAVDGRAAPAASATAADWRHWNAGEARARQIVLRDAAPLMRVAAATCPPGKKSDTHDVAITTPR
jgi:hypothetical protein